MAALRYRDEHNKVGYLQKPIGSADYHQILDFLRASHIRYALEQNPIIFDSLVKQFWSTATLRDPELGPTAIIATIDATPYTITEDSVRSKLQLADDGGIDDLSIVEIYSGMDNIGYVTEGKLIFFKNKFSPQWRFLVHTILHCLSTKFGSWDQFGSSIVVALICLSDGRRFNWSSYIFKGMRLSSQTEKVMVARGGSKKLEVCSKEAKRKSVISESDDEAEKKEQDIDMESLLALANASLAAQQSPFVTPSKDTASGESQVKDFSPSTLAAAHILSQSKLHAEKVAKSHAQVPSSSVRIYTRARRGKTTVDTPGGITDSSVAEDIHADVSIPSNTLTISPGNSHVPPGSSTVPTSSSIPASDLVPTVCTPLPTGSIPITIGSGSIPAAEPITTQSGTTP
ncbi:hypothetical protein Tco_1462748, partial [Tanacetum coccineum]